MFALVAYGELYFKGNEESKDYFENFGSERFSYISKGRELKISYYKVPQEVLEEPKLIKKWYDLAYGAALDSKLDRLL